MTIAGKACRMTDFPDKLKAIGLDAVKYGRHDFPYYLVGTNLTHADANKKLTDLGVSIRPYNSISTESKN